MKIISPRRTEEVTIHEYTFAWELDGWGSGFVFPCDASGNIKREEMKPAALENLRKCLDGTHDVHDLGPRSWSQTIVHAKIGQCGCGREVVLDGFTCPCDCGLEYNSSGQKLAPREQWGWDTGEDWRDLHDL